MLRTLFVATTNAGKLRDFRAAVEANLLALEPLPGIAAIPAPIEDADTFEGNARLKAVAYSRYLSGEIVLADDSGIEVDALGGSPGVYSARYAEREGYGGRPGDSADRRNNACLLDRLKGVPAGARTARYTCVLAAARDGEVIAVGEGRVEGEILFEGRGEGGFGYDPLFLLPGLGRTMAEIDVATKLSLSHRGRALAALTLQGM